MAAVSKSYATRAKRKDNHKPRSKTVSRASSEIAVKVHVRGNDQRVGTVRAKPRRNRASSPEEFKTSILNVRVKEELKEQATATLERAGISLSEAIRVFLGRVVSEDAFPFPLHIPNAQTAAALRDSIASDHKSYSDVEEMFDELEKGGVTCDSRPYRLQPRRGA